MLNEVIGWKTKQNPEIVYDIFDMFHFCFPSDKNNSNSYLISSARVDQLIRYDTDNLGDGHPGPPFSIQGP